MELAKPDGIYILNQDGLYAVPHSSGILEVKLVQYDEDNQDEFLYGTIAISDDAGSSKREFLEIFLRELDERFQEMNKLRKTNKSKRG